MPELPEVETVCRGLRPWLEGRAFASVQVRNPSLRRPIDTDFAARLEGHRVLNVTRRAKYILIHLDGGETLLVHLGMSGRFLHHAAPPPSFARHDHVIFTMDHGGILVFHDARRFGLMLVEKTASLASHPLLSSLGPEPLGPDFDGPAMESRLERRHGAIKPLLLDQRVVSGVGNIYACEALHRARLSPRLPGSAIRGRKAAALAQALREVLREAIAAGGSSLRDHRRPSGDLGYFQQSLAVYGRAGESCLSCRGKKGKIRRIVQGARSTFFCSNCQRG